MGVSSRHVCNCSVCQVWLLPGPCLMTVHVGPMYVMCREVGVPLTSGGCFWGGQRWSHADNGTPLGLCWGYSKKEGVWLWGVVAPPMQEVIISAVWWNGCEVVMCVLDSVWFLWDCFWASDGLLVASQHLIENWCCWGTGWCWSGPSLPA